MKHIVLCMSLLVTLVSTAQNEVSFTFDHRLSDAPFSLSQDADAPDDYVFELTRLTYYISDITITHDGGQTTEIADTWLLIKAQSVTEAALGSHDIDQVESVSFYVGVGPDVNNEDPAAWPVGHPLYPQNPSMHWGWTSGYRFVAIEGNAGPASSDNLFEIHALGNNNYFETTVPVSASASAGNLTIPLTANYTNALIGIDVSSGLINHATNGVSINLLQNFSTEVFSAGIASSLDENAFAGSLDVVPNPSQGQANVQISLPAGQGYALNILDISGRFVQSIAVNTVDGAIQLPILSAGTYIIELQQAGTPLTSQRWVVE